MNNIVKLFVTILFVLIFTLPIYANCNNICCKYIFCVISKGISWDDRCINVKHGKNCPVLSTISQSKIRYVVNPNYILLLEDINLCEICGGEDVDLGDINCNAYCCKKEWYVLDNRYKILHLTSCALLEKYYNPEWCLFKKKTYKLFGLKEIDFVSSCDICMNKIKRIE